MEQLFRSHYARMYNLARCILHDDEESKDVVSDVFARVMDTAGTLSSDKMLHYLLVGVRNRCYDVISHRQVRDRVRKLYPHETETVECTSAAVSDEERIAAILQYAEDSLTPQTCRVFRMRYEDGKQYNEIADDLEISVTAVYKHLSKALSKIRKQFKRDDYDD